MGHICGDFFDVDVAGLIEFDNACGSSNTSCTPECKDFLTATRVQLGCCVSVLNDSKRSDSDRQPYRYSLWSLCGVEPVTEQCATSFDLPTEIDPTCNISSSSTEQLL